MPATGKSLSRRSQEFRDLIDEAVDADWSHPGWRLFAFGAALLEAGASRRPRIDRLRQANAGVESDTFMSRDIAPAADCGDLLARAVLRARVTLDAMQELDGGLPGQSMFQLLEVRGGWVRGRRLAGHERRNVLFLMPSGPVFAKLTVDSEPEVVAALAAQDYASGACRPCSRTDPPVVLAAAILPQPLGEAMHLHRRAQRGRAWPWLGVGETQDGQEIVSTSHYAVDGYGHAWLSGRIFASVDAERGRLHGLRRIAARRLRQPPWALARPRPSTRPGFSGQLIDRLPGRFAEHAYAFARCLERRVQYPPNSRRTPAFQVSLAPGARSDPDRRRRRVLSGLLALDRPNGKLESLADFKLRLTPWLERERVGAGLLSRLRFAASSAPLLGPLRRRMLQAHPRHRAWLPASAALAGYGRLSSLRFSDGHVPASPLYAASYPPRSAEWDPVGSSTLTLIHHADGSVTASVFGVGDFGSTNAARSLLEEWRAELAASTRPLVVGGARLP